MTIDRGPDPRGQSVTEYLGVFWRRKWLIVLVVAIATVGGYVFSAVQTKHYQAQTQLIYSSQVDVANPLGNNSYNDAQSRTVDLQSVGTLLGSPDMTGRAEAELARQGFSSLPDYEVTAEVQSNTQLVQGQTDVYASVVSVYGDSTDPQFAAAVANAYAKVFIEWRAEQQKARLSRAIEVVGDQLGGHDVAEREAQLGLHPAAAAAARPADLQGERRRQLPRHRAGRRRRSSRTRRSRSRRP